MTLREANLKTSETPKLARYNDLLHAGIFLPSISDPALTTSVLISYCDTSKYIHFYVSELGAAYTEPPRLLAPKALCFLVLQRRLADTHRRVLPFFRPPQKNFLGVLVKHLDPDNKLELMEQQWPANNPGRLITQDGIQYLLTDPDTRRQLAYDRLVNSYRKAINYSVATQWKTEKDLKEFQAKKAHVMRLVGRLSQEDRAELEKSPFYIAMQSEHPSFQAVAKKYLDPQLYNMVETIRTSNVLRDRVKARLELAVATHRVPHSNLIEVQAALDKAQRQEDLVAVSKKIDAIFEEVPPPEEVDYDPEVRSDQTFGGNDGGLSEEELDFSYNNESQEKSQERGSARSKSDSNIIPEEKAKPGQGMELEDVPKPLPQGMKRLEQNKGINLASLAKGIYGKLAGFWPRRPSFEEEQPTTPPKPVSPAPSKKKGTNLLEEMKSEIQKKAAKEKPAKSRNPSPDRPFKHARNRSVRRKK